MVTPGRRDMKGLRDRALLLAGFAGAFRRSELVALDVEDIESCTRACACESAAPKPIRKA
jgi:site-specific recombinase XerD